MAALLPYLLFLDPLSRANTDPEINARRGYDLKQEKRLFCAACRHPVTHLDERIPVQGNHEHRFTNPHGITYHIGCYREAAGCSAVGEGTKEFSWFPGHAWRIVLCANCRTHLGWRFHSGDEYFHGLIVNRLTSAGPARN